MSGFEVLGIVASVLQIADVGARLSVKLCTFSHKVKYANSNIQNISSDVALTCSVLRELGDNLKKDEQSRLCNNKAVETAESVIDECMKVFTELEWAIDRKAIDCDEKKNVFKRIGKGVKFSFIEPQVELLRTNLERLKSTLLLMLNVIIYAGQLRSKAKTEVLQEQQELIKTLNEEKKNNDRKFDQLTKAIEGLGISQDEDRGLQKVDFNDNVYSSQHASSKSSIMGLQQASTSNSIHVNMVQVPDLDLDIQPFPKKLKMEQNQKEPPRFTFPHPLKSSEELSHYCFLVKHLLSEIEAVQWKLDQEVRISFREEIIRSHNRTADILTAKHGHERIYRIFNQALGDKAASSTVSSGSVEDLRSKNAIRLSELGLLPKTVLSAMQNGSYDPKILGKGQIIDSLAEEVSYRPPEVSSLIRRVYSLATPDIAMNPIHSAGPPALGHGPSNLFDGIMANPVEQTGLVVSPTPVQISRPCSYQHMQAPAQQQQPTMKPVNFMRQVTTLVSDVEPAARQVPMPLYTSYEPISTPAPTSQSTSFDLTRSVPTSFKGEAKRRKSRAPVLSAPPTKPFKLPEESLGRPTNKRRKPSVVTINLSKVAAKRTDSRPPSREPLQKSHDSYTMNVSRLTDPTQEKQIPPTTAHKGGDTSYNTAAAPAFTLPTTFDNNAPHHYSRRLLKRTVSADETNPNPEEIAVAGAKDTDLLQEETATPGAAGDPMAFTTPMLPAEPLEIQDFTADYVVPGEYFSPLTSPALAASTNIYISQVPDINEASTKRRLVGNDPAEILEAVGPMEACVNCQTVGVQCDARKPICHHCQEKNLRCIYKEPPLVVNARGTIYGAPVEGSFSKRTSHKVSEQGRRNRINIALKEIEGLLPPHQALVPSPPSRRDTSEAQNNTIPLIDEAKKINLGAERPDNERNTQDVDMTIALPQANSKARTVQMAAEYIKSLQAELASAKARLADQNSELHEFQKGVETDGTETTEHRIGLVGEGIEENPAVKETIHDAMRRVHDQSLDTPLSTSFHNTHNYPTENDYRMLLSQSKSNYQNLLPAFQSEFDDENHQGHLERPAHQPWSVEKGFVSPEIPADMSVKKPAKLGAAKSFRHRSQDRKSTIAGKRKRAVEFRDPKFGGIDVIKTTLSTSSEEKDISSDLVASKSSSHGPIGTLQAALTQATNEATLAATLAATNVNFDFSLMKAEAPKEYQASGNNLQRLDRGLDLVDDLLLQWTTWDRSTLDMLNRDAGMGDTVSGMPSDETTFPKIGMAWLTMASIAAPTSKSGVCVWGSLYQGLALYLGAEAEGLRQWRVEGDLMDFIQGLEWQKQDSANPVDKKGDEVTEQKEEVEGKEAEDDGGRNELKHSAVVKLVDSQMSGRSHHTREDELEN